MKTQEINNESMREILHKAQQEGVGNPMYREYLVGLTNSLLGTISEIVFTNALVGIDTTRINKRDIRAMSELSYQSALTDKACSMILKAIADYYANLNFQVENYTNLENEIETITIRIN